jgi:hypothetical protein
MWVGRVGTEVFKDLPKCGSEVVNVHENRQGRARNKKEQLSVSPSPLGLSSVQGQNDVCGH